MLEYRIKDTNTNKWCIEELNQFKINTILSFEYKAEAEIYHEMKLKNKPRYKICLVSITLERRP